MGIRVHKVIGYGLTDVKVENNKVVDERINPESPFLQSEKSRLDLEYQDYLKSLVNGDDKNIAFEAELELKDVHKNWYATDSFIHEIEYGLPNVLCFVPASCQDWKRYDDIIDYVEEVNNYSQDRLDNTARFKNLDRGIFPYDYGLMDSRTGHLYRKKEDTFVQNFSIMMKLIKNVHHGMKLMEDFAVEGFKERADKSAMLLGFKDRHEAEKYVAPSIPLCVRFLCEFGKFFQEEKTIFQLRPILYVYWS